MMYYNYLLELWKICVVGFVSFSQLNNSGTENI